VREKVREKPDEREKLRTRTKPARTTVFRRKDALENSREVGCRPEPGESGAENGTVARRGSSEI
jgi:hypothetical protein